MDIFRHTIFFQNGLRYLWILSIGLCFPLHSYAGGAQPYLKKGWAELVKDNDVDALRYFGEAYRIASLENDTEDKANALLHMGICTYGGSLTEGMSYCFKAMNEYKSLESTQPEKAKEGRSRCLQLLATIYARQGKYKQSIALSKEALEGFIHNTTDTTYLGLIYNSLGHAFGKLNRPDSAEYYHRLALAERAKKKDMVYLPVSYMAVANIELERGNKSQSQQLYQRALFISDSTGNRQGQVSALLGYGKWLLTFDHNEKEAEAYFLTAKKIAADLSDKLFYVRSLEKLITLKKAQGNFQQAADFQDELALLKDSLNSWEKEKMVKSLEVQFEVSEIDRKLKLEQSEHEITRLANYLLWGSIFFLSLISAGIILFLKRINNRDKQLLQTKEALVKAIEEQKILREQQMQNELEFKESQLSAMTLQMLQKNELMQELKEKLESPNDPSVQKIISKGLNQDKEWSDFNTHFESLNKNFYARLKQAYPDISPNDLRICALIKLNMSIKEMAGILNISPDSVKTARYRLRKKLQLNTEDNLTDFIMNL